MEQNLINLVECLVENECVFKLKYKKDRTYTIIYTNPNGFKIKIRSSKLYEHEYWGFKVGTELKTNDYREVAQYFGLCH